MAYRPDRLYRLTRDLEDLIDLVSAHRVLISTVKAGTVDLETAAGRQVARLLGVLAAGESETMSERVRRAGLQRAQAGKANGGPRAFGFEADGMTHREAEAEGIRDAAARLLAGESLASVARSLTAAGLPTSAGRPWTVTTLKRVVTRPRLAGLREHDGGTYPAAWEPILDMRTHERLRAMLLDPARDRRRTSYSYLLTGGLAVCGRCESRLSAHPNRGEASYLCADRYYPGRPDHERACGRLRVKGAPLEREVVGRFLKLYDGSALAALLAPAEDPGAQEAAREMEAVAAERADLAREVGAGRLSVVLAAGLDEALTGREERARARLASANRGSALAGLSAEPGALRAAWPDLPLSRQQAILRERSRGA